MTSRRAECGSKGDGRQSDNPKVRRKTSLWALNRLKDSDPSLQFLEFQCCMPTTHEVKVGGRKV